MGKQFDLEQQILACWNVTSDLDVLLENVMENDNLTKDNIANIVLGMQELYELKFDKCFRTFEEFLKEYYTLKKQVEASQYVANLDIDEEDEEEGEEEGFPMGSVDQPRFTDENFFTPDAPNGFEPVDQDVNDIRQQYHEELNGLSDDELVRTIRDQYEVPSAINVNVSYKD